MFCIFRYTNTHITACQLKRPEASVIQLKRRDRQSSRGREYEWCVMREIFISGWLRLTYTLSQMDPSIIENARSSVENVDVKDDVKRHVRQRGISASNLMMRVNRMTA